jgi:hypothetical protein
MARKFEIGSEMKNDIKIKWYKSCEGQNFDIMSQLYHPLKNDIKISLSSKKWYNDMIVYQWYTIFQCLGVVIVIKQRPLCVYIGDYESGTPQKRPPQLKTKFSPPCLRRNQRPGKGKKCRPAGLFLSSGPPKTRPSVSIDRPYHLAASNKKGRYMSTSKTAGAFRGLRMPRKSQHLKAKKG